MVFIRELAQTVDFVRKQQGWRKGFSSLLQLAFESYQAYLFRIPLDKTIPIVTSRFDFSFVPLCPYDLSLLEDMVPPLRLRRFAEKLRAGETSHMAVLDGKAIAYAWTAYSNTPSSKEIPLPLGPKDAYHWGAYCLPEYRSSGVMTTMHSIYARFLQEQGYQNIYQYIKLDNQPSLRLAEKVGAQKMGSLATLRLLGWRRIHYLPVVSD